MTKLAQMAPTGSEGGNTISPSSHSIKKEKRSSGAKRWMFTWNNYPEDWLAQMAPCLHGCMWIAGYEVGPQGTPHVQGYCEFPVKVRPIGYKGCPKEVHWGDKDGKPCKGSREHCVKYCSKDGKVDLESTLKPIKPIKVWPMSRQYQKDILGVIAGEPDDRMIYWIWSEAGGTRKTSTAKYLAVNHDALILGGKAADIRNAICMYLQKHGHTPELVVINIPKSFSQEFVSYESFENIKDMCFYSGKYEGGMVVGNSPHLIIFANFYPQTSKMTAEGRWKIINIDGTENESEPESDLDGDI